MVTLGTSTTSNAHTRTSRRTPLPQGTVKYLNVLPDPASQSRPRNSLPHLITAQRGTLTPLEGTPEISNHHAGAFQPVHWRPPSAKHFGASLSQPLVYCTSHRAIPFSSWTYSLLSLQEKRGWLAVDAAEVALVLDWSVG